MNDRDSGQDSSEERASADRPAFRIEATVHPGSERDMSRVADLDLDRIPDPEGQVRLLLTLDECISVLKRGYEVRLLRLVPVRPLDPGLVETDESVRAWLEERVAGLERDDGPPAEKSAEGS